MPILLDPNKKLINIDIYYVEEVKPPHNISFYHFIKSAKELNEWKAKGYKLSSEVEQNKDAGMPVLKLISKITVTCRRITWKDQNSLYGPRQQKHQQVLMENQI